VRELAKREAEAIGQTLPELDEVRSDDEDSDGNPEAAGGP